MSRKIQNTRRTFKVFCEGDTEYHYIDEMRKRRKLSIALRLVNMKGGGYSNFLDILKTDGNTNCLAKFIIIDGDRVIKHSGEKQKLQELIDYCILQNRMKKIPHILIVNCPDFEYIACLHMKDYKDQNVEQYIKKLGYHKIDEFKSDAKVYDLLNTKGNSSNLMMNALKANNCFIKNQYAVNSDLYKISVKTDYDWNKIGLRGSNFNEYFEILKYFY